MEWTLLNIEIILLGTRFLWIGSNHHAWAGFGLFGYGVVLRKYFNKDHKTQKCLQFFYPSPGYGSVWQIQTKYKFLFFGKVS